MLRLASMIVLLIPAWAAAEAPKPIAVTLQWSIALDAAGAIESIEPIDSKLHPQLAERIEPSIKSWHFTAGKIDGKPEPTQTTLTVHVDLEPLADGNYGVYLRKAGTGPRYEHLSAPEYPEAAKAIRRSAAVLLDVVYDADGHIVEAKPIEGGEPKSRGDFDRAAVAAVKRWTFTPESIAGHGVPGKARVPICFAATQSQRGQCRWNSPDTHVALDADQPLALGSVVHLETDIAGRMP